MKKVAVFGNAGGGKSTLSRQLADLTGLPWVPLDRLKYKSGGGEVSPSEFKAVHDQLLQQDGWIVDGFGSMDTLWARLEAADTLIYVDMPLLRHYWWVTKRLIQGVWVPPAGWPERSPLVKGTLTSYSVIWLCHTRLTPRYREYVQQAQATKRVYHLRSPQAVQQFWQDVARLFPGK